MARIQFKGNPVETVGELPAVGSTAPAFSLTGTDLSTQTLASFAGKKKLLNIFPSLDTSTCAMSVRQFHQRLAAKDGVVVLNISLDLPFAHKRFCAAEGITGVSNLSTFRSPDFGNAYGVTMKDGVLAGLLARAIVIIDENDKVLHTELVGEVTMEPGYEAALNEIGATAAALSALGHAPFGSVPTAEVKPS